MTQNKRNQQSAKLSVHVYIQHKRCCPIINNEDHNTKYISGKCRYLRWTCSCLLHEWCSCLWT